MMFSFVTLGTNNLEKSKSFYNELLSSIGIVIVEEDDRYVGYARKDSQNIEFYLMKPHNKEEATFGNGTMITFNAKSKKIVNFFENCQKMNFNGRRIYPFNKGLRIYGGVYHPPFDTLKKCTSAYDMNLKLYR